jgi:indole-3-glycerol phosphate synthase
MNADEGMAPAVESILSAAEERGGGDERLAVDARSLPGALRAAAADGRVPVIAEIKPTSPTAGGERRADPATVARAMVEGGAAALSVLTEPDHFGGSPDDLRAVREAVDVPVLRKDFLLSEEQLDVVAADAILVIARFVEDLDGMVAAARERGFDVLVEVHDREEAAAAVAAGADVIGVNNRDLAQLTVDLGTFERVAPAVREADDAGVTLIAESGIGTREEATRMRRAGADGLLIGSAIMDHEGDGPVAATARENTARLTTPAGDDPAAADGIETEHDRNTERNGDREETT